MGRSCQGGIPSAFAARNVAQQDLVSRRVSAYAGMRLGSHVAAIAELVYMAPYAYSRGRIHAEGRNRVLGACCALRE